MNKKFIKQPNVLFNQFGDHTGQILASSISCRDKIILIKVPSIYYADILELAIPPENYNFFLLLRSLVDENISIVNLGSNFEIVRTYPKTLF